MAEYNVDIQVRAKTQQVESQLTKLQQQLDRLSRAATKLDFGTPERVIRSVGNTAKNVGTEIKNIFGRGLFAGAVLGAGQLSTSITDVISKFGFLGKTAASSINTSLGGVPELVGGILNQIGHIPNAMGLAAVAAMAFAPQLLKASSAAVGLGAAVDKAVGKQVTEGIAGAAAQVNGLKMAVDAAKSSFAELIKGSTLNQLNAQLKDANYQIGEYHSSTVEAATAASQLVAVLKAQKAEQQAINNLVRSAQGLRSESEERRATNTYNVVQRRKKFLQEEAAAAAQAAQDIRALEQAESNAARTRLAEQAKAKADSLIQQATAARDAQQALQSLEQTESSAARTRLASAAKERQDRAAFLAGTQASQFPFGPNPRSTRRRFEGDVSADEAERALRAKELKQLYEQERLQLVEIDRLREQTATRQVSRIQTVGKAIRGSLSSAAIGGAFPLLFGQSPQAAVGGAIGGLLGGQAGGFAGSLVGTALGELAAAKERTSELAAELGFSSQQAQQLATAFEAAGRNSEQLQAAITNIQGLGLSVNETASAIRISTELADEYGGKVDKIAQAFADTLESGRVSISTLNKFTAQGIPIQDQLAAKLKVSRSTLLEMAKDGKISVQQVTDALVELGQKAEATTSKSKTGFDEFTKSVRSLATAIADAAGVLLKNLVPALNQVLNRLALIIQQATAALSRLSDVQVGQAYAGIFKAAQNRGTLFGLTVSKANIDDLTTGLKTLRPATAQSSAEIGKFRQVLEAAKIELTKYNGAIGDYAVKTAQPEITRLQKEVAAREALLPKEPLTPTGIENISAPTQLAGAGAGKDSSAAKAQKELERVQEVIRSQGLITLENQRQLMFKDAIFKAEMAGDTVLARRLEGEQQLLAWGIETANLLEKEKNTNAQLAIAKAQQAKQAVILQQTEQAILQLDLQRKSAGYEKQTQLQQESYILEQTLQGKGRQAELEVAIANAVIGLEPAQAAAVANQIRKNDAKREELALQQEINNLVNQLGTSTLKVFEDLIFATDNWRQSLAGALQMMATTLLRFGLNTLADMGDPAGRGIGLLSILTGRFGKRANGGPVSAGSPYLVGERGPELFMPRSSGSIYPNDAMGMGGSNIVVNVDATGTNVQGNSDDSKRLGEAIGVAIRQELIKQKRPGGLLS